ncbi:MAG: glycosyltransferase family 4 protein [Burkholderiaceae bacterium]|nr:glycosyltransferase family 4 protein [Microbacteriaceae bacterium]
MSGPSASPSARHPSLSSRARLYQTIRTAHLEQVRELAPATVIYRATRYDFDESAAAGLDLLRAGPVRAAVLLASSAVVEFEVNEPLMRYGIRGAALAVAALRLRAALGGRRAVIVTYGIENFDPFSPPRHGLRARASAAVDAALTRYVWRRVDRMVFGTEASHKLYHRVLGRFGQPAAQIVIPTLPSACSCAGPDRDANRVIFVGAFSARKGFDLLEAAWPLVVEQRPDARLHLLGKGPLEPSARAWAARDTTVDLEVDPARTRIHERLRASQVLVLPSQPQPTWQEQVGRPILEGLAHGCSIVTTTETGLASWLATHGHSVIAPRGSAAELATAILTQLRNGPDRSDVLGSLPVRDGRLAADDWLFAPVEPTSVRPVTV